MLDASSLSQLASLKNQFQEDKELLQGTVSGTPNRYGFVVTDEATRHFLPPDEMKRVLPGDRIEFSVHEVDGKSQAQVESLLNSELGQFVGQVVSRKNRRFVVAEHPGMTRWLSLTRKSAESATDGQWVLCELSRHPIDDGKALAAVVRVIGDSDTPFIEHEVAKLRHSARSEFPDAVAEEAGRLDPDTTDTADYVDRTELPLLTIDAASTRDMDDALYVTESDNGWHLVAAIADPTSYIAAGSAIDREALARHSSSYLPGETLHMLPERLSVDLCSLQADQRRPALLMDISIDSEGHPGDPAFSFGWVRSRAKLSYAEVSDLLETGDRSETIDQAGLADQLREADRLAESLRAFRHQHCMVMPDQPDFRLILNERGHIERIEEEPRNRAQQMVEELMLLINRSAAHYLANHNAGLFLRHSGFRPDQLENVRETLATGFADAGETTELPEDLADFSAMLPVLQAAGRLESIPLSRMVARFYQRAELSPEPGPHWGLGFDRYTTITSPIRKYLDLHLHRQIKALWRGETVPQLPEADLTALQAAQTRARAVANFTEQWLKLIYLEKQEGAEFLGTVRQVSPNGFSVQLDGIGMSGFVNIRQWRDNDAEFDPLRQRHQSATRGEFSLNQRVRVRLRAVDFERRNIQLDWLETLA